MAAGGARRVFDEAEVTELHTEALRIVAGLEPPPELLVEVYRSVVAMLGQHQMTQGLAGLPLPQNLRPH